MKIVSVIPESFMEYDDHISIVLFTFGCNLRCSYCYNYEFVSTISNIIDKPVMDVVSPYVTPLTDGLVWLGGEPTIYEDLLQESLAIKGKFDLDIKLFTNGSNPEQVLRGLRVGAFDYVSIDFKTLFNHDNKIFKNEGLVAKYLDPLFTLFDGIDNLNFNKKVEIRTTDNEGLMESELGQIRAICANYGFKHLIQKDVRESYRRLGALKEES